MLVWPWHNLPHNLPLPRGSQQLSNRADRHHGISLEKTTIIMLEAILAVPIHNRIQICLSILGAHGDPTARVICYGGWTASLPRIS